MATAEQRGHRLAPVAGLFPPQGQWTEADYFALPETNRYVELSEGCLLMPPHPTCTQSVLQRLFLRLQAFVEAHGLGIVRFAPLPVRLWPGKIREPDLFFIDRAHADRIGEPVCGVPDLVAEVLSPDTREVDRGEKFFEYARAGVREYWIVDPENRTIEVYVLRGHVYEPLGKFGPEETARSALLPGFEVPVNDIFAEINPKGQ